VEDPFGAVRIKWNLPKSILIIAGGYANANDKSIAEGTGIGLLTFGMTVSSKGDCAFNGAYPAILVFTETIGQFAETMNNNGAPFVNINADSLRLRTVAHELFHALGATHIPAANTPDLPHCHKDEANVEKCLCVMTGEEEHGDRLREYQDRED